MCQAEDEDLAKEESKQTDANGKTNNRDKMVQKEDYNYAKGTYDSETDPSKQTNKSGGLTDDSEKDGQNRNLVKPVIHTNQAKKKQILDQLLE